MIIYSGSNIGVYMTKTTISPKAIPRYLKDVEGNMYEVIMEKHRDGFNLVTYRLDYKDYKEE